MRVFIYIVICTVIPWSCALDRNTPLFSLVPAEFSGVDFQNALTHTDEFNMYTYRNFYNGGGVGIGDINNDGLPDLFFCGNLVDNKLYLNKGDFKFADITSQAGVASENIWSAGVSMADVNGDGWLDIYVCKSGKPGGEKRHNELFINNGDLTFSERAKQYGIADEGFSSHAAFFDYDKDGDLDCYLLNNSFRSVGGYDMRPGLRNLRDTLGGNKLYRNLLVESGVVAEVLFKDISEEAGIYGSAIGFGLGVTVGDVDRDGWQDIYVSNDFFERDYLYINQRDGTFKEDLVHQMREISMGSMGADMADINNDGLPEIFVTEMLPRSEERYKTKMTFENWDKYQLAVRSGYHHQFTRNVLQLNNGDQTFSEIGRLAEVEATDWSWSALMADFDRDGFKDIYVSNGIYKDLLDQDYINYFANDPEVVEAIRNREPGSVLKLIDKIPSEAIANFAFRNRGNLTFEDQTEQWGLNIPSFSNGSAYGDLDNDGDLDLVVNNVNMSAFLFRNHCEAKKPGHNFIQIKLVGDGPNSFALGSQISLYAGDRVFYQELSPMRGFQSSTCYPLNFGIGSIATLERIEIKWPDGRVTTLHDVAANQFLTIEQKHAKEDNPLTDSVGLETILQPTYLPLTHRHQENEFVDFDRDRLLFHMISTDGPKVAQEDVNGDGLDDLYFCGAAGFPGSLFIQTASGDFSLTNQALFEGDQQSEDLDAVFFDADGDSDPDLVVTSGGNEFRRKSRMLADRLYLNDGAGYFTRAENAFLNPDFESSSCVRPGDFDDDGDLDLFIGTRLITGVYGVPANGNIWQNDGTGQFTKVTKQMAPDLLDLGLVTDAVWHDIDRDGAVDLIVVGEWMPITVLKNEGGSFRDVTERSGLKHSNGLWTHLNLADLNNDGWQDLILGNHGLNSRLKAKHNRPLKLFINDFDGNRTAEQILTHHRGDVAYPLVFRDDLVMQIPSLKKKYLLYQDYKGQQISDIFDERSLKTAAVVTANETRSCVAWGNADGKYELEYLPLEAQFSPIYASLVDDFDNDGQSDLFLGGNFYQAKPEIGKYDASYGLLLRNLGNKKLQSIASRKSGIKIIGQIRDLLKIQVGQEDFYLVARNNDEPLFYRENPALITQNPN